MPQMANITVKKHDGTTDLVFKSRQPSAGDSQPARWSPDTTGPRGSSPTYEVVGSKKAGSSPGRRVKTSLLYPVYRDVSGIPTFVDVGRGSAVLEFPASFTDVEINELVAAFTNLQATALQKDMYREGYAAT